MGHVCEMVYWFDACVGVVTPHRGGDNRLLSLSLGTSDNNNGVVGALCGSSLGVKVVKLVQENFTAKLKSYTKPILTFCFQPVYFVQGIVNSHCILHRGYSLVNVKTEIPFVFKIVLISMARSS